MVTKTHVSSVFPEKACRQQQGERHIKIRGGHRISGGGREVDDENSNREGGRGRAGGGLQINREEGETPGGTVPAEVDEAGSPRGGKFPCGESRPAWPSSAGKDKGTNFQGPRQEWLSRNGRGVLTLGKS